mgnify:CR=1 FL=1
MQTGGRPRKYHTEVERKAAARTQARDCKRRRAALIQDLRSSRNLCKHTLCLGTDAGGGLCHHHQRKEAKAA